MMKNFINNVDFLLKILGDIKLEIPSFVMSLNGDLESQARDNRLIQLLEDTIHSWETTISIGIADSILLLECILLV